MMKFNTLIKALLLVAICTAGKAAQSRDSIWVENKQIVFKKGKMSVDLSLPILDSEHGNEPLLTSVNRAVVGALSSNLPIDNKVPIHTLDQLRLGLTSQANQIELIARQTPGMDGVPFEMYSTWSAFGNANIVSIYIERYLFLGGAHGKTQCTYLNFDPKTGRQVDLRQFIPDTAAFLEVVAAQFCKDRRLPKDALQLQTGLLFELSNLPMPRQLGFSDKGLVVVYNPLEIAPQAFGPITVTIPSKLFLDKWDDLLDKMKSKSGGKKSFNANTPRGKTDLWRK